MVLDYKDVAFSFQKRKTRRRRQRLKLALLFLAVLVLAGGYRYLRVRAAVGKIQDLLLEGQGNEAGARIADLSSSFFLRASIGELRAVNDLFADRLPQARARFAELGRTGAATSLRSGQFQKYFFDRGEYLKLRIYTDYLLPRGGDENTWYSALVRSAFFDGGESEKILSGLSPAFRKTNAKALALIDKVNSALRLGRCDYVFDKNGSPLAYLDVRRRKTRSLLPGMDFADFDQQLKNGLSVFRLTLDAGLQKGIGLLFSEYSGTLMLLGLPENNILAAYSKPGSAGHVNAVFSESYEPGSTVKAITLLAYLRQAGPSVFPYVCTGRIALGKKVFYDGMAHKQVGDYTAALAVSCNASFVEMGLKTGFQSLAGLLELFHFNGRPLADRFLSFQTGTFSQKAGDDLVLANLAVGLNEISLTTVHGALLAAVFSQDGLLYPPYLIDDAKSILDLGIYSHRSQPQRLLADDLNFRRVKKAIRATVDLKNVAGRPGAADLAIRTGIAGDPRRGLDGLAIGFFPYEKPRFAFAFRLEGAGKTELNEAIFLRALLAILQQNQ